ncbi:MAG TPA: SGNH/GDSL hydrolase family protein [Pyrinomonadaceae bacterium]|jgi:hypothetical protein
MNHIVLLGDSVFDNAAYVAGGPDVVEQLRKTLPGGWKATLKAVDGSVIGNVIGQLGQSPADATHLVVSVGGNDALGHAGLLGETARSVAAVLTQLADAGASFEREYEAMLEAILRRSLPTALCSIYYPRFPDPHLQRLAVTALTVFNDAILRAAFARGLPLLDLRLICDEERDYANPIEPSTRGGEKIAQAITRLVCEHDFARRRTEAYVM